MLLECQYHVLQIMLYYKTLHFHDEYLLVQSIFHLDDSRVQSMTLGIYQTNHFLHISRSMIPSYRQLPNSYLTLPHHELGMLTADHYLAFLFPKWLSHLSLTYLLQLFIILASFVILIYL